MTRVIAACIGAAALLVGVGSAADTKDDVAKYLGARLSERLSIDETAPNGPIQVTMIGEPVVVPGSVCLYIAEHLTLRRLHDGLSASPSTLIPYVRPLPQDGRCPAAGAAPYAELAVSLADFERLHKIVLEINRGRAESPEFRLLDSGVPSGTTFEVLSATYRTAAAADRYPVIEGLLKGSTNTLWYIDLDVACRERCVVSLRRTEILE
jgi:hypothetical protein